MSSAEQDQWKDICAAVRDGLSKQVVRMATAAVCDVQLLMQAVETAMLNEIRADVFDEEVAARAREQNQRGVYGGD